MPYIGLLNCTCHLFCPSLGLREVHVIMSSPSLASREDPYELVICANDPVHRTKERQITIPHGKVQKGKHVVFQEFMNSLN